MLIDVPAGNTQLVETNFLVQDSATYTRCRAEEIVKEYGRSSNAFLALLADKTLFFSGGGSLIAYTVQNRVAVTSGDPIGPAIDVAQAVGEFVEFCSRHGWLPAFCLTQSVYLDIYHLCGFRHLCLGHEGIVNIRTFDLHGRSKSNFRKRYHRILRQGYRVVILEPPLNCEQIVELRRVSDHWLTGVSGKEKCFFLGRFEDDYLRRSRVAAVFTPEKRIIAFANLVDEYQLNEISIDLARYRRDCPSGVIDFLFVSLFLWSQQQGYDTFNLGLSALSGVGDNRDDPLLERVIHWIYENGNWFYNFKGMHEFKRKFHPTWSPQYLVYPGASSLLTVWLAMARVNAGNNSKSPAVSLL
jgi:phosphatidylglycerol lysyltransferase